MRKAYDVIQSMSKSLRTRGRDHVTTDRRQKDGEPGALMSKGRKILTSQLRESEFALPLPFYSVGSLSRLDGVLPQQRGQVSLLNLMPSSNTCFDSPRNDVLTAIWA